eukprot:Lithocolla_globosa_v1_NODE_4382_length_1449_cov_68.990674.p2 type:complete len:122 gc:universal NODE_4382_length_1449_cov_68.990674:1122-757(-)
MVIHLDWARWHLVKTLLDDIDRLPHFFNTTHVTVITISISTNRNVEIHPGVGIVGLGLTQVPFDARTSQHWPRTTISNGIFSRDDSNAYKTFLPDAVSGQQLLHIIDTATKMDSPSVNVVQ